MIGGVIVRFIHGTREVGHRAMDAVPRSGESVMLPPGMCMMVWNVAWQLAGDEPFAWVAVLTMQEYDRELRGPHYREPSPGAG